MSFIQNVIDTLSKALDAMPVGYGDPTDVKSGRVGPGPEGVLTSPDMDLLAAGQTMSGYVERPSSDNWDLMRRVANQPPMLAVGGVMCDGIAEFSRPQRDKHLPGYKMIPRDKRDGRKQLTRAETKEAERLSDFMFRCGEVSDPRILVNRRNLEHLVRQVFWDQFRFDQVNIQIEPKAGWAPGGKFIPHAFRAWPAHTMRLALPPEDGRPVDDADMKAVRYVQVNPYRQNEVVAQYTGQQMSWGVLSPRTDIENAGYGFSDCEKVVSVLTSWLYGYGFNTSYFKQGANVDGLLNFETAEGQPMPRDQQRKFESHFRNLVNGARNAHKVPITWGAKATWIPFGRSNKDMEFQAWQDFLTKLLCAIIGIDPAEINFVFGNTGQSSAMGGASVEEKIQTSRNRWLRPRVRALMDWLNVWLVWQLNPDFLMVPTGLDVEGEAAEFERMIKMAGNTHTVNEVRGKMGDEPLKIDPDQPGDVILNPNYLQFQAAKQGAEEGEEEGPVDESAEGPAGAEGEPDEAEGDAPDAPDRTAKGKAKPGNDEVDDDGFTDPGFFKSEQIRATQARVRAELSL